MRLFIICVAQTLAPELYRKCLNHAGSLFIATVSVFGVVGLLSPPSSLLSFSFSRSRASFAASRSFLLRLLSWRSSSALNTLDALVSGLNADPGVSESRLSCSLVFRLTLAVLLTLLPRRTRSERGLSRPPFSRCGVDDRDDCLLCVESDRMPLRRPFRITDDGRECASFSEMDTCRDEEWWP